MRIDLDALAELRALCERDERECEAAMSLSEDEDDFSYFGEFCSRGYAKSNTDWERLFFSDSGVYEKRLEWLGENEARVRQATGTLHA